MKTVVLSDRDDTINYDEDYYLGSDPNWRRQVKIIPTVVDGIKRINSLDSKFFILSNQSGVALRGGNFDNLDIHRMYEVMYHIYTKLRKEGAIVDGYITCPFVDNAYVEKAEAKGRRVNPAFVVDGHEDIKPKAGMVIKALERLELKIEDCALFMIGDRVSDMEMILSVGGKGILIPQYKTHQLEDVEKAESMEGVKIVSNYEQAAEYIQKQTSL